MHARANIIRARRAHQPHADRVVALAIDDDETARAAILEIEVERHRPVEDELGLADIVEVEAFSRDLLERAKIDARADARQGRLDGAGADLDQVRRARYGRTLAHPQKRGIDSAGELRRSRSGAQEGTARNVDIVGKDE